MLEYNSRLDLFIDEVQKSGTSSSLSLPSPLNKVLVEGPLPTRLILLNASILRLHLDIIACAHRFFKQVSLSLLTRQPSTVIVGRPGNDLANLRILGWLALQIFSLMFRVQDIPHT